MTLLPVKASLENIILFLWCHMDHVKASHQHLHLLTRIPSTRPFICCRKCCFGFCGKAPTSFSQDKTSHHMGIIFLQWKNKCPASSSSRLQKGHRPSFITIWRDCRFLLVGNLSLSNLHAKTVNLLGTFNFHSSTKAASIVPSDVFPLNKL